MSFIIQKGKTMLTQKVVLTYAFNNAARKYSRPVFAQQLGYWEVCWNLNSAAGQHFCKEKMFTSNNIHSQLLLQQKHIKRAQKSIHAKDYYWLFSGCKQSCKLFFYLKIFSNRETYYIFRNSLLSNFLSCSFIIELLMSV